MWFVRETERQVNKVHGFGPSYVLGSDSVGDEGTDDFWKQHEGPLKTHRYSCKTQSAYSGDLVSWTGTTARNQDLTSDSTAFESWAQTGN